MSWGPLQKHCFSLSPGHTWRLCVCRHIQTFYEECGLFFFKSQLTLWLYSFPAHFFGLSDVRGENTLPPCPRGMWLLSVTSGRGQLWLLLWVTHGPSHTFALAQLNSEVLWCSWWEWAHPVPEGPAAMSRGQAPGRRLLWLSARQGFKPVLWL